MRNALQRRILWAMAFLLVVGSAGLFFMQPAAPGLAQAPGPDAIADLGGSAFPRDMDTGPSLNSDSLVIQLDGVMAPPAAYSVQGYLLTEVDGLVLGALSITAGEISTVREFPGINLVAGFDNFRLMWERTVFEDTLPDASTAYLRNALARADDTPNNLGYGVGLVREVNMMLSHANFAREDADRDRLPGARLHAEHVLNILYGKADLRHDDYNGDGRAENPGDGYGVLAYADGVYDQMSLLAESEGATAHMSDQAFAVLDMLSNFSPANGTGTWADEIVTLAHAVLDSTTAAEARPHATALRDVALRIREGIAAEEKGGAWDTFVTLQAVADYFPSAPITGNVRHARVSTSRTAAPATDQVVLSLQNVPQPPAGYALWGYLVDEGGRQLLLGELPWNNGNVEVALAFPNRNLIGSYSQFRLTEGTIYAQNRLPAGPLVSIRRALGSADDTPGAVGYGPGMMSAAQQLRTRAQEIQDALGASDLPLAKTRASAARGLLTGQADLGGDGFGVLGYAAGLNIAMMDAGEDGNATDNIIAESSAARAALENFSPATGQGNWSDELLTALQEIADAGTVGAATEPASRAATLAERILNGQGSDGGARAAYQAAQRSAAYVPGESGAGAPDLPPVQGVVPPDAFENDDVCARAKSIPTDGTPQQRNFHYENDNDWVRFAAQAGRTYIIEVQGVGTRADPVVFLFDTCESAPDTFESNAFGNTVRLSWNATRNGPYFIQLRQFDPDIFGEETEYRLSVTLDTTPPSAPTNLRCLAVNPTTVALQWRRSPQFDTAAYRVAFRNQAATDTGLRDVEGANNTFVEIDGLTENETYLLTVQALDFSGNESLSSGEIPCAPAQPTDTTRPEISGMQPALTGVYTTSAPLITLSGAAQDPGGNLSRVRVHHMDLHQDKTDFTLSGPDSEFRIEDIPLRIGINRLEVTVIDEANNGRTYELEVRRLGESPGAVIIVAGHNETFGLQTNIYNATNRAYRVFRSAGFTDDDIYYLAPVGQDATGDGQPNTRNVPLSPAALEQAITDWAKSRVGPDRPFYIYLMDHGFADRYCVTGCSEGNIVTPTQLNEWISALEDETDVDEVNIFIEACQSGSFLDNLEGDNTNPQNSLARQGRVVITSTGRVNNAYASADGAYFSDTFFSCLADSQSIKACFDEGVAAVALAGVDQSPWLDDNGDGSFSAGDGALASQRTVTRFFSAVRPRILSTDVAIDGQSGVLTAQVETGAEALRLVYAAVYPPSFTEPSEVTLNLNVPLVRLEPVEGSSGQFRFNYVNGFLEEGDYRVVFYAQDRLGIHATPVRDGEGPLGGPYRLYVPHSARE